MFERALRTALVAAAFVAGGLGTARAQDDLGDGVLEARLWLDRGSEPTLQRGERVRIYFRTSADAFVAIFHVNTDGSVRLLHPRSPDENHYARGGADLRLLFPRSPYWYVDEYDGIGYFFIVASREPFDFSEFGHSHYGAGWDLTGVGRRVYTDPYVAIDDYVASLIPNWEESAFALDFMSYHVGRVYEYPRFLCYDCHAFKTYSAWNPYRYACTSFRVVVYDDPYYYPAYRYRGDRVVYVTPTRARPRYVFKERAVGEPALPLVRNREPPPRRLGVGSSRGPATPVPVATRPPGSGSAPRSPSYPPLRRPSGASSGRPVAAPQRPDRIRPTDTRGRAARPRPSSTGTRPTLRRRPEAPSRGSFVRPSGGSRPTVGGRTPARSRGGVARPGSSSTRRPTLRRPTGSSVRPPRASPAARRPKPRSGGSSARPAPRPSTRPPARPTVKPRAGPKPGGGRPARRPPPKRKPGGGRGP